MSRSTSTPEYQALAQFRFLIRRFLNNSEKAARSVGLEPQQYMSLLTLRGLPSGQEPSIRTLAERLQIQHHSAVELVDRMAKRGLFRRERSQVDRRRVLVHVTPRGERLLSRLVRHRIAELRVTAPALTRALQAVLARRGGLRATSVQESQEARKRKSAGNANRDNTTPLRQE